MNPDRTWETGYKRGFSEGVYHLIKAGLFDEIDELVKDFGFSIEKLRLGLLESYFQDWKSIGRKINNKEYQNLYVWYRHILSNIHLLRREYYKWPSYKILLQVAVEHGDDSPLTIAAERWLDEDKCDWYWIRNQQRPENCTIDPCIAVFEVGSSGALLREDGSIISWCCDNTLRLLSSEGELLAVLEGHTDYIEGALLLKNGSILSWSDDSTLHLWSSEGEVLAILEGHTDIVLGALFLKDGSILSWSRDYMLRMWRSEGEALRILEGHGRTVSGALLRDDSSIISWGVNTLRLWSSEGELLAVLEGHTEHVEEALFREDGSILSWSSDNTLRLWSSGGEALAVLEGHTGNIEGALFREDGSILSWSSDNTLRLWSSEGETFAVLEGHTGPVEEALLFEDGRILSWSKSTPWDNDFTLRLWSLEGEPLTILEGHTDDIIGVLILEDGKIPILEPRWKHCVYGIVKLRVYLNMMRNILYEELFPREMAVLYLGLQTTHYNCGVQKEMF